MIPTKATSTERAAELPGDVLIDEPKIGFTHGIDINAKPDQIWPWLVQVGADRAGWYSHDWIDNWGRPSAREILPQFQTLHMGELVPAWPGAKHTFRVALIAEQQHLVLSWPSRKGFGANALWTLALRPKGEGSRLVARMTLSLKGFSALRFLIKPAMGVGHHIMQRKQLLELKKRAEQS